MTYGKANGGAIRRDRQAKARIERCGNPFPYRKFDDVRCYVDTPHDMCRAIVYHFVSEAPPVMLNTRYTWPTHVGADAVATI